MPNHSRRTSRVSRKRKVNRRRTKKGGASVSGDNTDNLFKKIYDDYKSRKLLESKQRLSLEKTLLMYPKDAIPLIPIDILERIGTAIRPGPSREVLKKYKAEVAAAALPEEPAAESTGGFKRRKSKRRTKKNKRKSKKRKSKKARSKKRSRRK